MVATEYAVSGARLIMVKSCCVRGCHNRQDRESDRRYFQIPAMVSSKGQQTLELTTRRRREWLEQLKLANYTFESTARRAVCSDHFVDGKMAYLYDVKSPSWKPTLKLGHDKIKRSVRKFQKPESSSSKSNPKGDLHNSTQEKVRPSPHHDHDYAIRVTAQHEEQTEPDASSRHNPGNFSPKIGGSPNPDSSLQSPRSFVHPSSAGKSSQLCKFPSQNNRRKGHQRKSVFANSPAKKGKGIQGRTCVVLRKEEKQVKQEKKASGTEPAPGVSLRALLVGSENCTSVSDTNTSHVVSHTGEVEVESETGADKVTSPPNEVKSVRENNTDQVDCHFQELKVETETGMVKGTVSWPQDQAGSRAGAHTRFQGLEALLEAANQIERMASLTSDWACAPFSTATPAMFDFPVTHVSTSVDLSLAAVCTVQTAVGTVVRT